MTDPRRKTMALIAALLWSLVGLLSGAVLGLAAGFSPRFIVFSATLGLAIGWFGFTGTYGRLTGTRHPKPVPALPLPVPAAGEPSQQELTREETRLWLDDFLRKQQGK